MFSEPNTIDYYVTPNQKTPFKEWLYSLKDKQAQKIIDRRLTNVRLGSFGDCEPVGKSVNELKIHYGPGYRIYFGKLEKTIVVLLCGGTKKSQNSDIATAQRYWTDYKDKE